MNKAALLIVLGLLASSAALAQRPTAVANFAGAASGAWGAESTRCPASSRHLGLIGGR